MANILIVDDEIQICRVIESTLSRHGHHCISTDNTEQARNELSKHSFELVFCNIEIKDVPGLDLMKHIKTNFNDIAVIMVTADDNARIADAALISGADGYILKPFNPNELLINAQNALHRRILEQANRMYQQELEKMLESRTMKLKRTLSGIIQAMTRTVEARDLYTAGHQQRVAELAVAISRELSLPKHQIEGVRMAGMIHDLGKISVPAEIISKPMRLTDAEVALIQTHPRRGYEIMADLEFPWPIAQIVLQHHEKINGSGYPQGLKNSDILLEARIICVADVVEAISSHRPYRPALGLDFAIKEITQKEGLLFDKNVVKACRTIFKDNTFSFASA
jgi:putative two-component system response regulator